MSAPDINFSTIPLSKGFAIGLVQFGRATKLHAFTPEMIIALAKQAQRWEAQPEIVAIWIESSSDRYFCAGGDLLSYYPCRTTTEQAAAIKLITTEYQCVKQLYALRTPIITWAMGPAFGGGASLQQLGRFRLISPAFRFAMPEVKIGYVPDCGVTYSLARLRSNIGLLMGIAAAVINANDVLQLGLADLLVTPELRSKIIEALQQANWSSLPHANCWQIYLQLNQFATQAAREQLPAAEAVAWSKVCEQLARHDNFADYLTAFNQLTDDHANAWLQRCRANITYASPQACAASFALIRQAYQRPLPECIDNELVVGKQQISSGQFSEGIRALLVDKDRKPRW